MNNFFVYSDYQVSKISTRFKRYLFERIDWNSRLIGIKGARGTGKTTLILQKMAELGINAPKAVYLTLDDLYFTNHTLTETVESIYKLGGVSVYLDEVHKYKGWAREIKNLYDRYENLRIVFSGSSIIDIAREEGDLSRRAVLYELFGLSYREYLEMEAGMKTPRLNLGEILQSSPLIKNRFPEYFRPLERFADYLEYGYYPYFRDDYKTYRVRMQQVIRMIVENDLGGISGYDVRNSHKMLQLLTVVSGSVPFKPNISKLADKIGISRNSLLNYLQLLERARLVNFLYPPNQGISLLQKPEKLYLQNPNLAFALATEQPDMGSLRETFALSQLVVDHRINEPEKGDLLVDNRLTLEIGGKNKSGNQLSGIEQGHLLTDDLEFPSAGRIPLWMLGLLY